MRIKVLVWLGGRAASETQEVLLLQTRYVFLGQRKASRTPEPTRPGLSLCQPVCRLAGGTASHFVSWHSQELRLERWIQTGREDL